MLKILIIEDEQPAAKRLYKMISEIEPGAELLDSIDSISGAIKWFSENPAPDLIFSDIQLSDGISFEIFKTVDPSCPVIFTTAYGEHAVESYELDAVDYLLKPFSFERFTKAVFKAIDIIKAKNKEGIPSEPVAQKNIFIKSDGKNYPVSLEEILYCEARKNYTMVVLKNEQKLMPLVPLSKFETLLREAGGNFIQVHRSFIIGEKHIDAVSATEVNIGKYQVPIGVQYREGFFRKIGMQI